MYYYAILPKIISRILGINGDLDAISSAGMSIQAYEKYIRSLISGKPRRKNKLKYNTVKWIVYFMETHGSQTENSRQLVDKIRNLYINNKSPLITDVFEAISGADGLTPQDQWESHPLSNDYLETIRQSNGILGWRMYAILNNELDLLVNTGEYADLKRKRKMLHDGTKKYKKRF